MRPSQGSGGSLPRWQLLGILGYPLQIHGAPGLRPIWWRLVELEVGSRIEEERDLNKSELIDALASKTGESKRSVGEMLEALIETVEGEVASGQKVTLPGFGTWERRERSARTARNPQTGEPLQIAASKVPAFKAGSAFKQKVNK